MKKIENKTLIERWKEEKLSDNSNSDKCKQCKDCVFQSDGTAFTNHYQKTSCKMYPYPNMKPEGVRNNKMICEYHNTGADDEE